MRFGFFGNKKTRRSSGRHARRRSTFRSVEQLEDRRMLVNDAPDLVVADATGTPGTEVVVPLNVSDTETPAAELFVFFDPDDPRAANATIDNSTKTFRWTPDADQLGEFTFVVLLTDRGTEGFAPLADAEEFTVTVTAPNQAPVNTVPGPQTVAEDADLVFSTANGNRIAVSDPDAADADLQVTLTATNGVLTLSAITGLTFTAGDGTDDATMTFTGTITEINAALEGLLFEPAANFSGAATLIIATDDQGNTGSGGPLTATDTIAITVTPVADTPSVTNAITQEGTQTTSGLVITRNPADNPEDVTHVKITGITGGTLFLNDGTTPVNEGDFIAFEQAAAGLRFTPTPGFTGTGTFQVQASTSASDAGLGGDIVPALITVFPPNDPPNLAKPANRTVSLGEELTFTATATDPNAGDTLTFTLDPDLPSFGATIDPSTGEFNWMPSATQPLGEVTFRIIVIDDAEMPFADSETFTVTVTAENQAPVITAISDQTIAEGAELSVPVTATDPDVGDELTFSLAPGAPTGATIDPQSGLFRWTPAEDQGPGPHSVTVMATDNRTPAQSQSLTFMVTVSEVNQAPQLAVIDNRTATVGAPVTFTASATDPDDPANTVTYSLEGEPAGATIDPTTGVFTWTPTTAGDFPFTVIATDNGNPALSAEREVTITVELNQAPVLDEIPDQTGVVGTAITFDANATDPEGDTLTYSFDNRAPEGATINADTGLFTWTPTTEQVVTFGIVVTDDGTPARTDMEEVTITVTAATTG